MHRGWSIDSLKMKPNLICFSLCLLASMVPGNGWAQTSSYEQIYLAGTFNGYNTMIPNMVLVDNDTWRTDVLITDPTAEFKFATQAWGQSWGDYSPPQRILPLAGNADAVNAGGYNIVFTNITAGSNVRFTFNDRTREYSVFVVNNLYSNLLYNGGFELAGSQAKRARYWEFGVPNMHGDAGGTAERVAPGSPHSGTYVGALLGTWAGRGNSGYWWQDAPVEPGLTYEASAWFQAEGGPNPWTAGEQQLKLEYYDFNYNNQLAVFTRDLASVTSTWTEHAVSGQAPEGAAWARWVVYAVGAGNSGSLRIDDARVRATISKRTENFNDWGGAVVDDCYSFAGWSVCTGKTVSAYVYAGQTNALSRSGWAASLAGSGSVLLSPRLQDGLGAISFYYRHGFEGDPNIGPTQPVHLSVQISTLGDFWEEVGTLSNIYNTVYNRYELFQNITAPRYVRIVHAGGSTNRVLIDDVAIAQPTPQPRFMDFNAWDASATNAGCHTFLNWQVCTGIVSSSMAKAGKAAHVFGAVGNPNALVSPVFSNGYGTINFSYRRGLTGIRTVGFSLEASTNGVNWEVLDTVSNVSSLAWSDYSHFYIQTTPHRIRIRNIAETNQLENIAETINESFDGGATPPPGWEFHEIGQYDSVESSGVSIPSLKFQEDGAYVITPSVASPTNATFMTKGNSIAPESTFTVEGLIGGNWQPITTFSNLTNGKIEREVALPQTATQIRFVYSKAAGNLAFDDLFVTGLGWTGDMNVSQSLILDNVNIGMPEEYRLQDFNTWPTKNSYTAGETVHQQWVLSGSVVVNAVDAFEGQSARMQRMTVGYLVDFEGDGETKGSYSTGTVTLNGTEWSMTEAVIGSLTNDYKNGVRSARLRGRNGAIIEMLSNKSGGVGEISFKYRRYGSDGAQQPWAVEYSLNNGMSWTQVGASITATAVEQTFSGTVNIAGPVRIRIRLTTTPGATGDRRINVDNILITDYGAVPGEGEEDSAAPAITSHYFPDGIGAISFRYRNGLTNAAGAQIATLAVQTSVDAVTWTNRGIVTVSNGTYELYEQYLEVAGQHYARVTVVEGTESVLVDNILIAFPGLPAVVTLTGWSEPELPFTNDWVQLRAQAIPYNGAHSLSVTSYYRVGTSGTFTALAMLPEGGNTFVSITNIPPQPKSTIVQYYMEAWYAGPGADLTRPGLYPSNAPTELAWYGIPRNPPHSVWINEVDYRSTSYSPNPPPWGSELSHEFVELAGYAETDISGWTIELRTGFTTEYTLFDKYVLSNDTIITHDWDGFGFFVLAGAGIEIPPRDLLLTNRLGTTSHRPGAIRLLNEMGGEEDAICYDGTVPAHTRITTLDPNTSTTNSLSLVGVGSLLEHFAWSAATTLPTPGGANAGQVFADPAVIHADPGSLVFEYVSGSFTPSDQIVVVSNAGASAFSYTVATNVPWLQVTPTERLDLPAGAVQAHTVSVTTVGLSGTKSGTLVVQGQAANSPFEIPVQLAPFVTTPALLNYSLDEGLGAFAVNRGSAGYGANLALANNAGWTLEGEGVSRKLGDFAINMTSNQATARTITPVTNLNDRTQYTVTGWLRPNATGGVHHVFGNRQWGQGFEIKTSADYQNLSLLSSTGDLPAAVTSTNMALTTNIWTFFAITFDASNGGADAVRFYRGTESNVVQLVAAQPKGGLTGTGRSRGRLYVGGTLPYRDSSVPVFPPVTNGLVLNLNARALSGLQDGDLVTQWADVSGYSQHATNLAANLPRYRVDTVNGWPVLVFSNSHFGAAANPVINNIKSLTAFLVVNAKDATGPSAGALSVLRSGSNDVSDARSAGLFMGTASNEYWRTVRQNNTLAGSSVPMLQQGWQVLETKLDGTNNTFYVDGAEQNAVAHNLPVDVQYFSIGAKITNSTHHVNGDYAQVLLYKRALTDVERASVEEYLAFTWKTDWLPPADEIAGAYQGRIDDLRFYEGAIDVAELESIRKSAIDRLGGSTTPPVIQTHPQSQVIIQSQTAYFSVSATGSPLPSYIWRKDGVQMPGKVSSTLAVETAQLSDAGNYDVIVYNVAGTLTSQVAVLTVQTPPVFTQHPTNQTAAVSSNVTFVVAVTGTPTPSLQWNKDGTNILGAVGLTYTVTNVQASDMGNYYVVASNAVAVVTSHVAVLTVEGTLAITSQPLSQTVFVGETVEFNVDVVGLPPPTYQWWYNNGIIGAETNATLTMTGVQLGAEGNYVVTVANTSGTLTSQVAVLTVKSFVFDRTGGGGIQKQSNGNGMVLRWGSLSNHQYHVYWTTNAMGPYGPLATNLPATPPMNVYTDSVHGLELRGFYQIRLAP